MSCPDENALLRFVEQTLPADEAAAVRAHIEGCQECRRVTAELTRLRSGGSLATPAGPAPQLDDIPLGTRLGRYLLLAKAGSGAMGVVYAAYDPALDRKVALKLLRVGSSEEATARLLREGQVLARLNHPNVIGVHDIGSWESRTFIAMEFIAGGTARQWQRDHKREWDEVLKLYLSAGAGLAAAHAQGQVHRDFKPDNVLVHTSEPRVLVTDFGLATAPTKSESAPEPIDAFATREGTLLGTPAYMAPEQLAGESATAASDQFSFCVSLWEGLYGARPFRAESVRELREAILAGKIIGPDQAGSVPGRIRRTLARGLDGKPEARYPSMDALLEALRPPSRKRPLVIAFAAAGVIAVLILAFTLTAQRAALCSDSEARLAGVWDGPRKAAVEKAFVDTKAAFGKASFDALAKDLDAWAAQLVTARTQACEATRVAGSQSEDLLGLRMGCFDDRLSEVRALTELYAKADTALILEAHRAVARLPPLSACADEKGLRAPVRPAADPATAQKVTALRTALSEANALEVAGQYAQALTKLKPLAEQARTLAYRPLEAEVLTAQGDVQDSLEDYKGAESSLTQAVLAAEAGGHLSAEVRAWTYLSRLQHGSLAQFAASHQSLDHAAALLERLGPDSRAQPSFALNAAALYAAESKFPEANAEYLRAIAYLEKNEPDSVQTATAYNQIGIVLRAQDKLQEALDYQQRALKILEARLGPDHPHVAKATKNIGNFYWGKGEWDKALVHYQRTLAIQEKAHGPESLEAASTQNNVAAVYTQQGKYDEAVATFLEVLAIREKALGPDHPGHAPMLNNLGVIYGAQKKFAQAESVLRRALAIAEKAHGPVHAEVETALVNLGEALLNAKKFKESADAYARAAAITEKLNGLKHPNLAEDLAGQGMALLALKDAARALTVFTRAMGILAASETKSPMHGVIHFGQAQAMYEAHPKERTKAIAQAKLARAQLVAEGERMKPQVEEVDAWLGKRKK